MVDFSPNDDRIFNGDEEEVVTVPATVRDFTVSSAEDDYEAASILFGRAWDLYDDGADMEEVDRLLDDALALEMRAFELSDYDEDNDLQASEMLVFHGEDDLYGMTDFSRHVHGRTMDALMETIEELDAREEDLDRGPTNHNGTIKTELAEKIGEQLKQIGREREKAHYLVSYMNDVLGVKPSRTLDNDG